MKHNAQAEKAAVPRHVAIVMDGNGRWAQKRYLPRMAGHQRGVQAVHRAVRGCMQAGVEVLSLFAFSSENWQRPSQEVSALMRLFVSTLDKEVGRLHENGIRLRFIGDRAAFSDALRASMAEAEALTRDNDRLELVVAANYGGRWDLLQAQRRLAAEAAAGRLDPEAIDEQALDGALSTAGLPDPDLFVRTGGEQRISNFLLWQMAYTELYFCEQLWPDFDEDSLEAAFAWFGRRERRFGRTSEQLGEAADDA